MVKSPIIQKQTLHFLKKLAVNNNREWFNENRILYEQARLNVETFMDALISKMNTHDHLETLYGKKSLYRIYNDVRFLKDKSPYAPRFSGYLRRSKPLLRGGYYFWIKPGDTHVGCGFAFPKGDDLKRIRTDMSANFSDWKKLLRTKSIVSHFGEMQGDQVRTTPRGFHADDPAIALLRYKQFWFERHFSDREVLAPTFLSDLNNTFKAIRPFFNYTSELLTTDFNGESLY